MSFSDTINQIEDIPSVGTLEPGRFWWLHGVKQARTPGVFYVRETELPSAPAAPWQSDNRFDNEAGFSAAQLNIAFIGYRSQWFLPQEQGQPPIWIMDYQDGAKKQVEYLCFVQGIEDVMVLSVSGKHKAQPIDAILRTYQATLLKQASRIAHRPLPLWTFWLPIANQRNGDGKTAYIEATGKDGKGYGSFVTPPALFLPENALDTLFVGEELLRRGADTWNEYADWFKAKRLPPRMIEGEVMERPALPAPRNVPVPIDEGDIEF